MNLIDLLGVLGVLLILVGVPRQIAGLLSLLDMEREARRDLRPVTGFGMVAIGWYLIFISMGAAVKAGVQEMIFVTTALLQGASIALYVSGFLMIIGLLLLAVRKSMPE